MAAERELDIRAPFCNLPHQRHTLLLVESAHEEDVVLVIAQLPFSAQRNALLIRNEVVSVSVDARRGHECSVGAESRVISEPFPDRLADKGNRHVMTGTPVCRVAIDVFLDDAEQPRRHGNDSHMLRHHRGLVIPNGGVQNHRGQSRGQTVGADHIVSANLAQEFGVGGRMNQGRIDLPEILGEVPGGDANIVGGQGTSTPRNVGGDPGDFVAGSFPALLEGFGGELDPSHMGWLIIAGQQYAHGFPPAK